MSADARDAIHRGEYIIVESIFHLMEYQITYEHFSCNEIRNSIVPTAIPAFGGIALRLPSKLAHCSNSIPFSS